MFHTAARRMNEWNMNPTANPGCSPKKVHLLLLPFELREMIFGFAVYRSSRIMYCKCTTVGRNDLEPPIARTCRQVRDQALQLFFRLNRFVFSCCSDFRVPAIPARIGQMRHITIASGELPWDFSLDLTKGLPHYQLKFDVQLPGIEKRESAKACERKVRALVASWARELRARTP